MSVITYVVPCFDEASRLDLVRFGELAEAEGIRLLFVDDGSSDDTLAVLRRFCASREGRASVMALSRNVGKGEAVRAGLRRAIEDGALLVGYADADLATPGPELLRIVRAAEETGADVVMGSRISRAGANIVRRPTRHYLGRAFATCASFLLDAPVYDTQCGAKLFRVSPRLSRALDEPFVSRWVFDVELLARLLYDPVDPLPLTRVLELPLDRWEDVRGSRIRVSSVPAISADIVRAAAHIMAMRRTFQRHAARGHG